LSLIKDKSFWFLTIVINCLVLSASSTALTQTIAGRTKVTNTLFKVLKTLSYKLID